MQAIRETVSSATTALSITVTLLWQLPPPMLNFGFFIVLEYLQTLLLPFRLRRFLLLLQLPKYYKSINQGRKLKTMF